MVACFVYQHSHHHSHPLFGCSPEPFRTPVDWKTLGLYDYPQLVKKPMDLGSVKKKISGGKYKSIPEAAQDVRLVWQNCMTYNADGSDFYLLAKNLAKKFEEKYAKLVEDHQIDGVVPMGDAAGVTGMVTLEEKKAFSRVLYKISKEDLGKIIVEVDGKCPMALTKNNAEDEAELNVDLIPVGLFRELKQFADSCGKAASKKTGKKKQ
ncbi:MAG: hypothetical protein SGARI_005075 [Bacillariaceae sp.]